MKNIFKMTAIATSIMASSVAFSVTNDHGEDVNSTTVNVTVPEHIEANLKVTSVDLSDMVGSDISKDIGIVVCQNTGAGFTVGASTEGLKNGDESITIPMTVAGSRTGADLLPIACADVAGTTANANLNISVLDSEIASVPADVYSGTVSITVTSN